MTLKEYLYRWGVAFGLALAFAVTSHLDIPDAVQAFAAVMQVPCWGLMVYFSVQYKRHQGRE